ncbi:MAG TPA: hypothetical protein PKM67_03880 [Kiritimatiellia bacterium]|nr:hypothetical protein [Kiritimatiellia bacterium]
MSKSSEEQSYIGIDIETGCEAVDRGDCESAPKMIRKGVFALLTEDQSRKRLRSIVILTWAIAFVGIRCWALSKVLTTEVSSDSPPIVSLDRDFPIAFGDSREKTREVLGEPQEIADVFDGYSSDGIRLYYSIDSGMLDGILFTPMPSGTTSSVTVLGIKIGDSFERVKHVLGEPAEGGRLNAYSSLAVWNHDGNFLIVVFLRANNDMRSDAAQIDEVFGITYCREWSYARHESIIVKSIEEIRRGQRPSLLDEPAMVSMDLSDPCFQKPYIIHGPQGFPYGGSYAIVDFHESKNVFFWIYPLMGVEPRIRSIREIDKDGNRLHESKAKANNPDEGDGE